jgi:mannonate dehydratase
MKMALLLPAVRDEKRTLATQVGVRHAVTKANPQLTKRPDPSDFGTLRSIHQDFADAGITLVGLEGDQFDMNRIKRGLPGRDQDIDRYRQMLRNMGRLGIGLLCYNFMPRPAAAQHDWHRTRVDVPLRGGSLTTEFDLSQLPQPAQLELTHEQLWDNYTYFIRAVMPVAEEAGVNMGLHPDDPPLPTLNGVARLFNTPDAFDRAHALAPSPRNGITFCQANFRLMLSGRGTGVPHVQKQLDDALESLIRRWKDRIHFVHIRDVQGDPSRFIETWHDEGPTDIARLLKVYHDIGFTGPMRDDHVPSMHGERPDIPGYAALGHLFAVGYLRGLMQAQRIPFE